VTDHSLGIPADLGAAWLHFADQNAWTGIAEAAGFTVLRREPGWGANAGIGGRLPTPAERAVAEQGYLRYQEHLDAVADHDVPVSEAIPTDAYRSRFDAIMTWAVGVESREVSTLDLARYADSEHNWAVREGLGTAVAAAAAGLNIALQTEVTAIDWSGSCVRIASSGGDIEAGAVIITVPTSVLARAAIRFTPVLPPAYTQAFNNLPLGVANKVFYRLQPQQLPDTAMSHFLGRVDTSRTCSYLVRPAAQPLLCAYFGGDLSRELEQRGELDAFARGELQQMLGAEFVASLGPALTTAWGSDPYACGSYSAARPGHADCRGALATPVTPRLQFAGEACSTQHYGTLHGAWLSGCAAAERLL
jgi:monoamine oxidase